MRETPKFDAKNPSIIFDATSGDRPPSDSIVEAVDKWMGGLYDELQAATVKCARPS
jgi:hypothetical protein